jgi:hypothetical protein
MKKFRQQQNLKITFTLNFKQKCHLMKKFRQQQNLKIAFYFKASPVLCSLLTDSLALKPLNKTGNLRMCVCMFWCVWVWEFISLLWLQSLRIKMDFFCVCEGVCVRLWGWEWECRWRRGWICVCMCLYVSRSYGRACLLWKGHIYKSWIAPGGALYNYLKKKFISRAAFLETLISLLSDNGLKNEPINL